MLFSWTEEDLRYFWMKDTNFSLDLIFINSDLKIVDIFITQNLMIYLQSQVKKSKIRFRIE